MMTSIRQQITLFVTRQNEQIEEIRSKFNPLQFNLIAAHVTLCREDEIVLLNRVIENCTSLNWSSPLTIHLDKAQRFDDGKGVLLPARENNELFHALRKEILKGVIDSPRIHIPHITLMHPRNSTCTDAIFSQIKSYPFPDAIHFDHISLIEQQDGQRWNVVKQFSLIK